jgi:hypothetical protein
MSHASDGENGQIGSRPGPEPLAQPTRNRVALGDDASAFSHADRFAVGIADHVVLARHQPTILVRSAVAM